MTILLCRVEICVHLGASWCHKKLSHQMIFFFFFWQIAECRNKILLSLLWPIKAILRRFLCFQLKSVMCVSTKYWIFRRGWKEKLGKRISCPGKRKFVSREWKWRSSNSRRCEISGSEYDSKRMFHLHLMVSKWLNFEGWISYSALSLGFLN